MLLFFFSSLFFFYLLNDKIFIFGSAGGCEINNASDRVWVSERKRASWCTLFIKWWWFFKITPDSSECACAHIHCTISTREKTFNLQFYQLAHTRIQTCTCHHIVACNIRIFSLWYSKASHVHSNNNNDDDKMIKKTGLFQ